jgi:hypothetical protein
MRTIGALVTTAAIILLVVLAIGFWQGWFAWNIDTHDRAGQREFDAQLSVDKDKIKQDLDDVVDQSQQLATQAEAAVELTSVDGRVTRVDLAESSLLLELADGEQLRLLIDQNSDLTAAGERIELANIAPGDRVAVVYRSSANPKTAHKVTVLD